MLASAQAGKPWVVANDEQGPADLGVPPDPGYPGFAGKDAKGRDVGYTLHDIRKHTLWGNLMAGGAGVEYYFGYRLPDNDLVAENFRSRDKSWDYGRIALEFFHAQKIPFWEMTNADALVGNDEARQQPVLLREGERGVPGVSARLAAPATLDLVEGGRAVHASSWFDPRNGGALKKGSVPTVKGGAPCVARRRLPTIPTEDWLAVVEGTDVASKYPRSL